MSRQAKIRLDRLIVQRGLVLNPGAGRREILAGNVFVDGMREDKPGTMIREDAEVTLAERGPRYASRGGEKLVRALEVFEANVEGRIAIDIGASTGGFTDVLLRAGATKVYSVDVGYGQLAWELRQDPRVVVFDRTNARYITPDMFDPRPDFATVDVSFISLFRILPPLYEVLLEEGRVVCLVKPQFEAGREKVGRRGVVRNPAVHADVLRSVYGYARDSGYHVFGYTWSPITGPQGNIEFFAYLGKAEDERNGGLCGIAEADLDDVVEAIVSQAHETHGRR
ncbi:MAG: TlyA family RNA methyltransferase [Bacillota bacterium]|jgi:23S rRNA (cytidine1920-2'-O)/16S rRNA (cytidine1409-2'-O)-methyltransferase|nr:TlyA family RNA methyltransferase [Bacillota bacterium]HAN87403.1 TlyA family rRNA (cytidine-2'-O)-methyltransferase [Bacillota bacterium]